MKTVWKYSMESEAKRLIHCAHQMAVGFYRVNNFIVLPYVPKATSSLLVTFPDLPYIKIPRFWEKVKKVNVHDFPIITDPRLVNSVIKFIENDKTLKLEYENTKKQWQKAEKEIVNKIYEIIPSKKGLIKKLIIHPTSFGTGASFSYKPTKNGEIYIYLRQDKGIIEIVEAIVTSLTRDEIYKNLSGMWQESEIITDWILTKSSLADIIRKYSKDTVYVPTVKGTRIKQQTKIIQESSEFYKILGIPMNEKVFNLNGLTPEVYKNPVQNLSSKEKVLLRILIEKAGDIVTFDEMAKNLFSNDDKFSLYAISKSVERLRNKLEENGISGSYIQTLRGQGYVLKN